MVGLRQDFQRGPQYSNKQDFGCICRHIDWRRRPRQRLHQHLSNPSVHSSVSKQNSVVAVAVVTAHALRLPWPPRLTWHWHPCRPQSQVFGRSTTGFATRGNTAITKLVIASFVTSAAPLENGGINYDCTKYELAQAFIIKTINELEIVKPRGPGVESEPKWDVDFPASLN